MIKHDLCDTIAAVATSVGESGIAIVRISGPEALSVADKVFKSKDGKRPPEFMAYTTHYGWVVKGPGQEIIDEVILTVMRGPKSYTREDTVEINCHGGIAALRGVLELVLENGCRLAQPGEFTKRAFLNGRIDLAQAEAVLDIIRARTESALKTGLQQLKGALSGRINRIRKALLGMLSPIEASIDFPEEDISALDVKKLSARLNAVKKDLDSLLDSSKRGRIFREGIQVAICGSPNVGKSSLLNALLKQERSIVTPVAGTTRDTIEELIDVKGIPVRIVDTAGIIGPRDTIEKQAVMRSRKSMAQADMVILLFDGSRKLSRQDLLLAGRLKKNNALAVINKIDLKQRIERQRLRKRFGCLIEVSAKRQRNISLLEDALAARVYEGKIKSPEPAVVSNLRHVEALIKAQKLIANAVNSLDNKSPIEFVAQDLKDALGYLDYLLGRRFSDDLLDRIFGDFCIGK